MKRNRIVVKLAWVTIIGTGCVVAFFVFGIATGEMTVPLYMYLRPLIMVPFALWWAIREIRMASATKKERGEIK